MVKQLPDMVLSGIQNRIPGFNRRYVEVGIGLVAGYIIYKNLMVFDTHRKVSKIEKKVDEVT